MLDQQPLSLSEINRAQDKVCIFISITSTLPNPMLDHLLESSHRDDSNKKSKIGFGEEITQGESIEFFFFVRILSGALLVQCL